ncbi:MAG: outer membrane beta-barrel protein, partial [Alphaproteobacteria bacterium]
MKKAIQTEETVHRSRPLFQRYHPVSTSLMGLVALGLGFAIGIGDANAQYLGQRDTVKDRARPELDALGVRAGSFLLFPSVEIEEAYDDNIFKTDNATVDDHILSIRPALSINSQWSQHALGFSAGADSAFYADNDDEDYTDYNFAANGRVDIRRDAHFRGGVSYDEKHEDRGSPDDANGVEPSSYNLTQANAALFNRFTRVSIEPSFNFSQYDYDDVRTSAGTIINNDDRDRDVMKLGVRTGYMIVPDKYEAFVRFTYNDRDYDDNLDDNGFNRDSDGYE